jgi:hypothetical protein
VERMTALVGADKVIRPPHSLQVCFPRPSDAMMIKYTLMPITLPFNSADQTVLLAGVCVLINVDLQRIDNFMSDYQQDEETQKHLL